MRGSLRWLLLTSVTGLLLACSEEPKTVTEKAAPSSTRKSEAKTAPAVTVIPPTFLDIVLRPEDPTSSDCLQASVIGKTERTGYQWFVNGVLVTEETGDKLCSDYFKRDDEVSVTFAKDQLEASASAIIGNSPPRITGVTATAEQALHRGDISIKAAAEDVDDDDVKFRYQWIINGEVNLFYVDDTLPGDSYIKGDTLQFRITPYDGFADGLTYESAVLTIPNAPPQITSQLPQQFESREYTYQVEAKDPDDTALNYHLEEAPQGMTIDGTGLVVWPLTGVGAGTYPVKISVADPEGAKATQEFSLTLGTMQK